VTSSWFFLSTLKITKVHRRTVYESPEGECRYSSTLSLTSALAERGGQSYSPFTLPPAKQTRYPFQRRFHGPPRSVWTNEENLATTGIGFLDSPARKKEWFKKGGGGTRNKYIAKERKMKEIRENKTIGRNERIEGENMGMQQW